MNAAVRSDRLLLEHMDSCMQRILEYTGGDRATFYSSTMVQDAVLRNLQTIAESTQRLGTAIMDTEECIPWRAIAGFRNVLTHGYLDVDLDAVWSVVDRDLPELRSAVRRMIRATRAPR